MVRIRSSIVADVAALGMAACAAGALRRATTAGGRERFKQEGVFYGPDHHLAGVGDDALWRTFETDIIAVKGDAFAGLQYVRIPDFGATRPGSAIATDLLKLLLTKV